MRVSNDDLPGWLDGFKTRFGLTSLVLGDAEVAAERANLGAAYVEETMPARYAAAVPSSQPILEWVATVVRMAVERSTARGQRVATVHDGPSLVLFGPTGTGKTHQVYGAFRVISALGLHTRWQVISAADLYARLRPRHGIDSEAEFRSIADASILAVDDLGAAKPSEWTEEVNFRLVNHRYEVMKPTLFTSNLLQSDLRVRLGERVASRLVEMTDQIIIDGDDWRRAA